MKTTKAQMDFLGWVALLAALTVSASGEYELAHACGFGPWVAAGVPAALDVYAVRAMRAGRDVLAAVLAMIVVNAFAHLTAAGLVRVSVPLVVAVSALAPLVLWRVHRLGHGPAEPEPVAPEVDTTSPQENTAPVHVDTPVIAQVTAPALEAAPGSEPEPAPEADTEPAEVDTTAVRLDTEAALNVIRVAWVQGLSVREAAAQATRSPSYVQSVYARLNASKETGPSTGQTLGEAA